MNSIGVKACKPIAPDEEIPWVPPMESRASLAPNLEAFLDRRGTLFDGLGIAHAFWGMSRRPVPESSAARVLAPTSSYMTRPAGAYLRDSRV